MNIDLPELQYKSTILSVNQLIDDKPSKDIY